MVSNTENGVNGVNGPVTNGKAKQRIQFDEWLDCSEVLFDWADCYDKKDWTRLAGILAPQLRVQYDQVNNVKATDMPASRFVEMMRDELFLGDPLIVSQHMIGATKWERVSDEEIISHHQSRAAHLRWTDETRKEPACKGHGHGVVTTFYKKIDGVWKWAGIKTMVVFNEYDFENVFRGSAGKNV